MQFRALCFTALAISLLTCGCPQHSKPATDVETGPQTSTTEASPAAPVDDTAAKLNPAQPVPADEPLARYAGLTLGMSSFELAQVYPAPEGRGVGFSRVIEDYGDVQHHIIAFDIQEGGPERRIIASLYRDQLYLIIDRRDGINGEQIDTWREECFEDYGNECHETINGAQWTWEGRDGVSLVFTQDNATPDYMDAHVIVTHAPTQTAAHAYLQMREAHEGSR